MTEVDKVFHVAARRIQGLTAKVNYWKQRSDKLEAELCVEKAARLVPPTHYDELQEELQKERSAHAESCRYLAEAEAKAREWGTENKRFRAEIIPEMEKQRDGLTTQIQDMRNEIARLRADLRVMSELSNGSEWEQKAVELEELRAELNSVKQERDCAKSEWDRAEVRCKTLGGEVAELFSDRQRLKAELAVIKDERNELRGKLEASEAESRGYYEELSQIRREPNTPTPRSHPVKVGEYVKNDNGDVRQVREVYAEYLLTTGWRWAFEHCIPCDPPENTEQMMLRREREFAVKEAKANAAEEPAHDTPEPDLTELHAKGKEATDKKTLIRPSDSSCTCHLDAPCSHCTWYADRDLDADAASHDTPAGKETAQAAVTPQPGDVVRLVRFPTPKECREWSDEFGKIGELATVISDDDEPCPFCVSVVRSEGCMDWPLSCIEIVDAKRQDPTSCGGNQRA